jgi:hypothetical protein
MIAPDPPPVVYWLTSTGVVLTSLHRPFTPLPGYEGGQPDCKPCVERWWVPYAATAWARSAGGPWRPLAELPPAWGLAPLRAGQHVAVGEDEDELRMGVDGRG